MIYKSSCFRSPNHQILIALPKDSKKPKKVDDNPKVYISHMNDGLNILSAWDTHEEVNGHPRAEKTEEDGGNLGSLWRKFIKIFEDEEEKAKKMHHHHKKHGNDGT